MIPDAEAVLTAYLKPIVDDLGATVRGRTPGSTVAPWVRLTLLDAPPTDPISDHHIAALIQLDCYAGRDGAQAEAELLARTVRASLRDIAHAEHAGAVVTGSRISGFGRVPDTALEPARERVIVTATVWMH